MEDTTLLDIKRDTDYIIKKVVGNGAQVDSIENWGIGALNSCYKVSIKNSLEKFFLKSKMITSYLPPAEDKLSAKLRVLRL